MNRQSIARVVVVVSSLVVLPVLSPLQTNAQTSDEQREVVEQITDELERLEEQSDILAEDYVTAIDEKNQLDADVAVAEQLVTDKEAQVAALRSELSEVAVRAFSSSGSSDFGPLFSDATEYMQVLQRDELSRIALSTGTATTDELDQAVSDLEEERNELERKRGAAADKAAQVEAAKAATEDRTAEYQQARQEAEAELGALLIAEEEARARASYEKMLAEQAAAQQAAEQAAAQQEAERAAADLAQQRQQEQQRSEQQQAPQQQAAQQQAPQQQAPQQQATSNTNSGGAAERNTATARVAAAETSDDDSDSGNDSDNASGNDGGGEAAPTPLQNPNPPAPTPEPAAPPASSRAGTAVQAALGQLGVPYRFAAASPGVAFDCSGLTSYAWGVAGVSLPHQSRAQYASLPHVSVANAQPGDLLFFYSPISHVSIYLGNGQHVHAPNSGTVVNVATVNWSNVVGVGRPG